MGTDAVCQRSDLTLLVIIEVVNGFARAGRMCRLDFNHDARSAEPHDQIDFPTIYP